MTFQSINPANGEPFASYEEWQPHQVQDVIGKAHEASSSGGGSASKTARYRCARRRIRCARTRPNMGA
jgi:acyl-CoA reductase-like NAD-dependent aldehyde dehydrogenase